MPIEITVNNEINFLELLSNVLSSWAWPLTIFGIILIFKKPIEMILKKINKISFGDNELSLSEDLSNSLEGSDTDTPIKENTSESDFSNLAKIRPDMAVIDSYRRLEDLIFKIYSSTDFKRIKEKYGNYVNPGIRNIIKYFNEEGILTNNFYGTFVTIHEIRNKVVHDAYSEIEYADAILYNQTVNKLIEELLEINWKQNLSD